MPKREVLQTIIIGRGREQDGKDAKGRPVFKMKERIKLVPGQVFDFTDEELAEIVKTSPNAVTSKMTVDLDNPDSVAALNLELGANETNPPAGSGNAGDDI